MSTAEFIIWVDASVTEIVLTPAEARAPVLNTGVFVRPLCRFSARTWSEASQIRNDLVGLGSLDQFGVEPKVFAEGWSLRRFLELESIRAQLFPSDDLAVLDLYCNVVELLGSLWAELSHEQKRQVRLFSKGR